MDGQVVVDTTSIEALRKSMQGDVLVPGEPAYDSARMVWNVMIDKRPAVIARCLGRADVVAAVHHAASAGLPIAVRGGGHNSGGSGTCDGGLLIDLSLMRGVALAACPADAQPEVAEYAHYQSRRPGGGGRGGRPGCSRGPRRTSR